MSIFELFEYMRRANADFYTANPLEQLSEPDLIQLAEEVGITLEELREHINTPHVEMTCPLCGQPATHLVNCRGCCGDAWGGELVMAYGEEVHDQLREQYQAALTDSQHLAEIQAQLAAGEARPTFTEEQIAYASKHAYGWGGCMICSECWHHTLPAEAYQTCPIKLLADRTLEPGQIPFPLLATLMAIEGDQARSQAISEWLTAVWDRWVDLWNTTPDQTARRAIAVWRDLLLRAGLAGS